MPTAPPFPDLSAVLPALAEALLHTQADHGPARCVTVTTTAGGIEVAAVPLEGHPADTLLGLALPDAVVALGVACSGWAARYDAAAFEAACRRAAPADRPGRHPGRRRVRQATVVGRSGSVASCLHLDGERPVDAGRPAGLILDCLLRALDRPTDPPPVAALEVLVVAWCQALAALGRTGDRAGGRWSWPAAIAAAPPPEPIGVTWGDLRWAAVDGAVPVADLSPSTAAWMDDGMFARWVLPAVPDLRVAQAAAAAVLTDAARRHLDTLVTALTAGPPA